MTNRSLELAELYRSILITANEGGIGYWCATSYWKYVDETPENSSMIIHEFDDETGDYEDEGHTVDIEVIAKGFRMLEKQVLDGKVKDPYFTRFVLDARNSKWNEVDFDAEIADVIVQLALFDEVVYG